MMTRNEFLTACAGHKFQNSLAWSIVFRDINKPHIQELNNSICFDIFST